MLIICLVLVLLLFVVVTALVLYYMRNKGRAYRAILQDLAVPKEENSRKARWVILWFIRKVV